jgi:hypothetical protein
VKLELDGWGRLDDWMAEPECFASLAYHINLANLRFARHERGGFGPGGGRVYWAYVLTTPDMWSRSCGGTCACREARAYRGASLDQKIGEHPGFREYLVHHDPPNTP